MAHLFMLKHVDEAELCVTGSADKSVSSHGQCSITDLGTPAVGCSFKLDIGLLVHVSANVAVHTLQTSSCAASTPQSQIG